MRHTDILGQEIKEGDYVLYSFNTTNSNGNPYIAKVVDKVIKINPKMVKLLKMDNQYPSEMIVITDHIKANPHLKPEMIKAKEHFDEIFEKLSNAGVEPDEILKNVKVKIADEMLAVIRERNIEERKEKPIVTRPKLSKRKIPLV